MPALVTKTVRLKKEQNDKLLSPKYKDRSSFLVRELLEIFWDTSKNSMPGMRILELRRKIGE